MWNKLLQDRVAIITGAASGIGRAAAVLYARHGARVIVADVNDTQGEHTAKRIRDEGGSARFIHVDVSQWEDAEAMARAAVDEWGRIDVLYNNAAATKLCNDKDRAVDQLDERIWDKQIDITLKGVYLCSKACLPAMLKQNAGVILNVSSCDAILPESGFDSYTAAKGGVIALTKAMAVNYGKKGIRVNCISPGYIMTEVHDSWAGNAQAIEAAKSYHLTPRLGRAEDVANMALYLASDLAGFITGAIIPVDGGFQIYKPTAASEFCRDPNA